MSEALKIYPMVGEDGYDPTDHPSAGRDKPVPTLPISGSDIDSLLPPQTLASHHWHLQVLDERDLYDFEDQIRGDE